jgi:serine/threonine protein kinase
MSAMRMPGESSEEQPIRPPSFSGTARFELVRRLGEGGMGVVYEAIDRSVGTRIALKTIRTPTGDTIFRFKREFRALQGLRHPNLVGLGELFRDGGRWFFTMELVEGTSFSSYVRGDLEDRASPDADTLPSFPPQPTFDEERLRDAFSQLMRGLAALHAVQRVHRDVKPSNVVVCHDGRVVLLDFGLARDCRRDLSTDGGIVGTVAYMAPEQAAGRPVGPAADLYAAGTMLYEALTGRLPFGDETMEVLFRKQSERPPPPRSLVPNIPADLDALCQQLLEIDPAARPTALEVLALLGPRKQAPAPQPIPDGDDDDDHRLFVGRARELAQLRDTFRRVEAGASVTLFIEGESGIGKSALVSRFAREVADRALVLSGRCYERESVPYKAFDGIIDALSRYMMRLSEGETAALLPRNVNVLTQVFPVLSRVTAVRRAPRPSVDVRDPQELRTRLFAAVRELFARLADRRPLVIVIDDFQWADADSSAMLVELLNGPDAPRVLVLGTCRSMPASLAEIHPERLELSGLGTADARALAAQLLGSEADRAVPADAIAAEAAGHPLFIDALVRHARRTRDGGLEPVHLDEALWARVMALEASARELLELVAVAGARIPQGVIARAAGVAPAVFARDVACLRDAQLARTAGLRSDDVIECYHDRVRESVVAHLTPEQKRRRHEQLALSLTTARTSDEESLMLHWREAGDTEQASLHAARAAQQAEQALAFNRAARLYELAIALRPGGDNRALLEALGNAYASDGRGKQAAEAYLAAAGDLSSGAGLELRRRAAEQLLTSGYVEQGTAVIDSVLAPLGMRPPKSARGMLCSFVYQLGRLVVRGRRRGDETLSPEDLLRIDACLSGGMGLVIVDVVRGSDFFARAVRLAIDGNDEFRLARALSGHCGATASLGGFARRHALGLRDVMREAAAQSGAPLAVASVQISEGLTAVHMGSWAEGLETLRAAQAMLRERCVGTHWELNCATLFELIALFSLGRIRELAQIGAACARDAERRGNVFGQVVAQSHLSNAGWLVDGDVEEAARQADLAVRRWSQWSPGGVQQLDVLDLLARGNIAVYSGRPAWHELGPKCAAIARSVPFRIELNRILTLDVGARVALSEAVLHATEAERPRLLKEARRAARRLQREAVPWVRPLGILIAAQLHAIAGKTDAAVTALAEAAERFDAAGMAMHAAIARIRRGQLVGGDEGAQLRAAGTAWMARERIAEPERWLAMLSPGFACSGA